LYLDYGSLIVNYRKGDKLQIIKDNPDYEKGHIFTFKEYSNIFDDLLRPIEPGPSIYISHTAPYPLTNLERIIYGVTDDN